MLEIPLVLIFNYSTKNRTSGIRTSGDRTSGGPPVYECLFFESSDVKISNVNNYKFSFFVDFGKKCHFVPIYLPIILH